MSDPFIYPTSYFRLYWTALTICLPGKACPFFHVLPLDCFRAPNYTLPVYLLDTRKARPLGNFFTYFLNGGGSFFTWRWTTRDGRNR
jgi:hypothetical protein